MFKTDPLRLGRAIKVARARKGWTQAALAKKLDVSATYVSQLERDQRDPSWSFLNSLARALEVPLPLLLLLGFETDRPAAGGAALRSLLTHELLALVAKANDRS